jgi:hypothetical protein
MEASSPRKPDMDFEELQQRARAARNVRTQRDAAEKKVSGERLRRGMREAFARVDARKRREQPGDTEPDPPEHTDP